MKDKEMVTIAYSNPAKAVSIIGDFPSYNKRIKLNYNAKNDKRFSINLYLPPGKYYFKYDVDDIETVEYNSPIEILNGEKFNVLKVKDNLKGSSSESLSKFKIEELIEIDQRIITLEEESLLPRKTMEQPDPFPDTGNLITNSIEPPVNNKNQPTLVLNHHCSQKTKSLLDFSNSFSMKVENTAHDYNNQMLTAQSEEKVIVYNIADDFLIPMVIIKEGITDSHYAKFHYVDRNEDIIIRKNDVFYQPIETFDPYGNLADVKIINELSLLKNMQSRIASSHNFCFIADIMILFNRDDSNKRKFFISEFIRNGALGDCKTVIYKNNFIAPSGMISDDRSEYEFFANYVKLNHLKLFQTFESLFERIFALFKVDMRFVYHFAFEEKSNKDKGIGFTFIPLFPSNCLTNTLYEKSILFQTESPVTLSTAAPESNSIHKDISSELSKLELKQSLSTHPIKAHFQEQYSIFSKLNSNMLNDLYTMLSQINLKHHFSKCLKLLFIAHFAMNNKAIFTSKLISLLRIDSQLVSNVKAKSLMFYSNIAILTLLNYLNHLLSFQFKHKESLNDTPLKQENSNSLILFFNSSIKEDDMLLNEVIRQQVTACDSDHSSNRTSISQFFKLYTYDNISQFEQSLSSSDIQMISIIENIYDLSFLKELYKAKFKKIKLIEIFKLTSSFITEQFSQSEQREKTIRQVWLIDPGVIYADFFASQEKIVEFLQITQIVEYALFYRIHQGYFRRYSYEQFFRLFLPILSDIDSQFNPKRVSLYKTLVRNFIADLQTFQGIKEGFEVSDKDIQLGFKTFETMLLLLKNLNDESALTIQKTFKGRRVLRLITLLKQSAVTIQRYYLSKIYNKMKRLSQGELATFLINKYLHSDPIIVKLIMNSQKKINDLNEENSHLQVAIEEMHRNTTDANAYPDNHALMLNMANTRSTKHFTFNKQQKEEIDQLKDKLRQSRTKFKDLVVTIAEYEKKMENFVKMINANREVKEVLYRNGIKLN